MKNKSKLLLLPASLLLLSGCGASANTSIPRGYTDVDKANPEARDAFFAKVAEDISLTYSKGVEGFLAEGSFSIKELSYSMTGSQSKKDESYMITNVKADYTIGLVGLNEGTSKAKAVVKVENAGFNLVLNTDNKEYTLVAKDLDVAAYFVENTVYFDLSDKDVKNFANSVIDFNYATEGESDKVDEIAKKKENVEKYLGKYFVKDNNDVGDIANNIPKALTSEEIGKIKSTMAEVIEEILANDKAKDLLILSEDKNSKGAAIGVAMTSEPVEVDGVKASGDLTASLVFDKEGIFSRFGFAGNLDVESKSSTGTKKETFKLNKLDFGASFKYGTNSVKLPNFSDYAELPAELLD